CVLVASQRGSARLTARPDMTIYSLSPKVPAKLGTLQTPKYSAAGDEVVSRSGDHATMAGGWQEGTAKRVTRARHHQAFPPPARVPGPCLHTVRGRLPGRLSGRRAASAGRLPGGNFTSGSAAVAPGAGGPGDGLSRATGGVAGCGRESG